MNNKIEALLNCHIQRLEKDISERDQDTLSNGTRCNPWHEELDKVDLKNIASLREGRIPQYSDHIAIIKVDTRMDMSEFADLSKEMSGYEWPR